MSEQPIYRVIRGSIRLPRTATSPVMAGRRGLVMQGEMLPEGIFTDADIASYLEGGRIQESGLVRDSEASSAEPIVASNPFKVDPGTLAGKSMEDLVIMVLEIDDEFDVDSLEDEQAAVRVLTSGWQPSMRQTVTPVNDRSRPEALALHKMEQEGGVPATSTGQTEMSDAATAGLAAAKQRAQAPASQE